MQTTTIQGFNADLIGNSQVYNLHIDGIGDYSIMCGRYLKAHMRELRSMVERGYIRDQRVVVA